jgi:P-type Ca2+ transporter type 2C
VPLQHVISLIVSALQLLVQISGVAPMLNTDTEKGISGDDSDLMARQNAFGPNTYPRKKGRSLLVC